MTPRAHSDLIIAWANGAIIQYKHLDEWFYTDTPSWCENMEYRVAPVEIMIEYDIAITMSVTAVTDIEAVAIAKNIITTRSGVAYTVTPSGHRPKLIFA